MLTVNQLTLTHRKDLTVLVDSLSFTLNDGERLALIGEEGNGKSTLLRVLAGDPSVESYIEVSGSFSCRDSAAYLPQELPRIRAGAQRLRFLLHVARLFQSVAARIGRTRRPVEPAR